MLSRESQPYGLTAIHPRPIEVGVFLPGEDKCEGNYENLLIHVFLGV